MATSARESGDNQARDTGDELAAPVSPAGTEPLPFDADSSDEDEERATASKMETERSAQDELDAAATLASVPQARGAEGGDAMEEQVDEQQDAESKQGSDLSSDLSDEGDGGSGEEEGEADNDGQQDDDEEEDAGEEQGSDSQEEDASELSEDEEDDAEQATPDEGATTALDALAGLAAADSAAAEEEDSEALKVQRSRKKSLISAMDEPMVQEETQDNDSDEDDGSEVADSQELTTGDVLSSAISGAPSRLAQAGAQGDPNSAGSKLKKSLLSNATGDDQLVGASSAANDVEASAVVSTVTSRAGSPVDDAEKDDGASLNATVSAQLAQAAVSEGAEAAIEEDAEAGDAEGEGEAAAPTAEAEDGRWLCARLTLPSLTSDITDAETTTD